MSRILSSSDEVAQLQQLTGVFVKSVSGTVTFVGTEVATDVVQVKQGTSPVVLPNGAVPLGVLAVAGTLSAASPALNFVFTDGTTPTGSLLATNIAVMTTGLTRLQMLRVNGADAAVVGSKTIPGIVFIANNAGVSAGTVNVTVLYI